METNIVFIVWINWDSISTKEEIMDTAKFMLAAIFAYIILVCGTTLLAMLVGQVF